MHMVINLFTILLSIFIGYQLSNILTAQKEKLKKKALLKLAQPESLLEKTIMLKEEISILKQLSQNISFYLNLDDLSRKIAETTCKILDVEICVLLILNEASEELSVVADIGVEHKLVDKIRIKKGEEISGIAAKYNEIIVNNDFEQKKGGYNLKYEKFYKNSLVSLPLSVKGRVLGILNASNKKSGSPFSPDDVQILNVIASESAIALQNLKLYEELQENYLKTIIALANAIDAKDPYTRRHSQNVTKHAVAIAEEMKLPAQTIEDIRRAGLLHDIGKIGIKDEILFKPGKLTEEEYLQIKTHPLKGEEIIKSLPFLAGATGIVRHHHERFDGKGYPNGIKGENIELGARILAVADSFDAITTDRPYRPALSLQEAKNELNKNKGAQFDPEVVDCFLRVLEKNPS